MKTISYAEGSPHLCVHETDKGCRPVVDFATRRHEKKMAQIGVTRAWCGSRYGGEFKQSYARSVAALIVDVHSPMDYSPVHARWDVVY